MEAGEVERRYPSFKVKVDADGDGFSGLNHEVWLAAKDVDAFCAALSSVLKERTGFAELRSMSPSEFVLRLEASEKPFRPIVNAQLRHVSRVRGRANASVEIPLETEPASIEKAIAELRAIRARVESVRGL
jgi:hypothetical protein